MNSYYRDSTVSVSMATIDHKHTLLLVADIKRTLKIILESKSEFDFISLPTQTHTVAVVAHSLSFLLRCYQN